MCRERELRSAITGEFTNTYVKSSESTFSSAFLFVPKIQSEADLDTAPPFFYSLVTNPMSQPFPLNCLISDVNSQ